MKPGCGRRLISSRLIFKSACWGSLCSKFDVSSIVCALYPSLISILTLWLPLAEDRELPTQSSTKSLHCTCSISAYSHTLYHDTGHAHTSCTYFNWNFELMSSLRSNYALYRGTMLDCDTVYAHKCSLSTIFTNPYIMWVWSILYWYFSASKI